MLSLESLEKRIKDLSLEAEQIAIKHHGIMGAINELNSICSALRKEPRFETYPLDKPPKASKK